jgi:hypothetical protein
LSGLIVLTVGCNVIGNPEPARNNNPSVEKTELQVVPENPQKTVLPRSEGEGSPQQTTRGEIRQWAASAQASSQYSDQNWSAAQATGKPDVFKCGDNTSAWASENNNTVEWIELTFPDPVIPTEINIYQSFNPSQIVEVMMYAANGERNIAWEGYPELVKICPDLMTITLDQGVNVEVNKIRITIDQQVNGWGWNEIDAVELVGRHP